MINKIKGVLQITRFLKSLLAGIVLLIISNSVNYAISGFIFLLFSFTFNDLVDYEQDKKAHPDRALPKGILSKRESIILSIILLLIGVSLLFNNQFYSYFLIFYIASIIYSAFLKKIVPSIATFIWVLLIVFLVLLPLEAGIIEYLLVFSFFYFRELLLDLRDSKTDDQYCKTKSLPTLLGKYFFFLLFILFLISIISAILLKNLILIIGITSAFSFFIFYYKKGLNKKNLDILLSILLIHLILVVFI